VHSGYIQAVNASLHPVFLGAVPFAILAFAITWLLKEVPLRKNLHAPTVALTRRAELLEPES
jgi:hypothetical protein